MKITQAKWLAVGLLVGALAAIGNALAADPPAGPAVDKQASAVAKGELASNLEAALPLDATRGSTVQAAGASQRAVRQPEEFVPRPPIGMRVGLEVLVDGTPQPTVTHQGTTYLPVTRLGTEYTIRVWNQGPRRIVALVSVDGLSVINGQAASDANPGYVVSPYGQVQIKGWRRDLSAVAAFRFVDRDRSYAAQVGKPEKVGTISLTAIEEKVWARPLALDSKEGASPARQAHGKVGSIGTEYGREIDSQAYYVPFTRSANRRTITFHYDTIEALRAAGVPVDLQSPEPIERPNPFAPPPPGYKRK